MGNISSGTIFQKIIYYLHDSDKLTKKTLINIIKCFDEIDEGGYAHHTAFDSSDIYEIVVYYLGDGWKPPEYTKEMFDEDYRSLIAQGYENHEIIFYQLEDKFRHEKRVEKYFELMKQYIGR